MKKRSDPRHQARIISLQKLFSQHFSQSITDINPFDPSQIAETTGIKEFDKELTDKIISGVEDSISEIDGMITTYAPQWPIDQIQKVDLELLRIALWEGFISKITPPKVAIDEAIEIAKEFGGETSSKFINGVLGAIYEKSEKDVESK